MADPIQEILPASEAFKEGTLEMATAPAEAVVPASLSIHFSTIVTVAFLAVFATIAIISFFRRKKKFAFALVFPLCVVLDYSELFVPDIFSGIPHGTRALGYLGMAVVFVLLRLLTGLIFKKPKELSFEYWKSSRSSFSTYFCLMAVLTTILCSTIIFFGFDKSTVALIALSANALVYLLELVRVGKFLRESCSVFSTILYLCGLEIAPAAAMVAISIWL